MGKHLARTLGLALWLTAAIADAQTIWGGSWYGYAPTFPMPPGYDTRTQVFPLGPGLAAEKLFACNARVYGATQCVLLGWRPSGFTFGSRPDLARALTFSGDARGRVIASTERDVVYSDDRGRSWQRASWNGVVRPQIIAMDPETRTGVAVAEGAIHVTDDGGASWRFVRELPGRRIVQVVVSGRSAMLTDGNGGLWGLVNGNELTVISESGTQSSVQGLPQFSIEQGAIVARDLQGREVRFARNGTVDRSAPSTLWGR